MAINFGWILILNKFIWHFLRAWCPCYLWAVRCALCRRCGWSRRRCPPPAPPTGPGYTRCRHTCRTQRAAPARPATCNNQQGSHFRNTSPRIFANQVLQQIVFICSGDGKHSFAVGRNLQISSWTCPMSMHGLHGPMGKDSINFFCLWRPSKDRGRDLDLPPGGPTTPAVSELTVRQASTACTHCCDQGPTVMFCWYKVVRVCYRSRNLILISSTQWNVDISLYLYWDKKLFSVIFPIFYSFT